jgi:hypothetical protein
MLGAIRAPFGPSSQIAMLTRVEKARSDLSYFTLVEPAPEQPNETTVRSALHGIKLIDFAVR